MEQRKRSEPPGAGGKLNGSWNTDDLQELISTVLNRLYLPVFVKDDKLRWIYLNEAAQDLVAPSGHVWIGRRLHDVFPKEEADVLSSYDRLVLKQGVPVAFEQELDRAGVRRTLLVRKSRHETACGKRYVVGLVTDITAYRETEQEKAGQERYYHSLFENTGSSTFIFDDEGLIRSCNTQFERLTGFSKQELIGRKHWQDIASPAELDRLLDYHRRRLHANDRPPREYDLRIVTKQGDVRFAHATIDVIPGTTERVMSFVDITERKQTEEALEESLNKYKALIETTDTGFVVTDAEGIVLDANEEYCRQAGRPREAVLGRSPRDWILPSEKPTYWEAFRSCLRTGKLRQFQTYYQHPDGRVIAIESNATRVVTDGVPMVISLIRDVSERKQAEDALRASEQRFRILIDNMPVLIHAHDENGNVIFWNKECERVLGWTAREILEDPGLYARLFADSGYFHQMMRQINAVSGAYCELEVPMVAKSGEMRMISWTRRSSEIPIPGWRIWETGVDVTERRRYLAKLADLNRYLEVLVEERTVELQEQKQALELANKKLQELTACDSALPDTVSSDISAPLTSLLGFSKRLEREFSLFAQKAVAEDAAFGKGVGRASSSAKGQGERLKRLTNDFLDLSKIESGRIAWHDRPVDFAELAGAVRSFFESCGCGNPEVEFVLDMPDTLPELVMDPDRLLQILQNLLLNAVQFTGSGQIVLRADSPEPGRVRFMIADTGSGMEEKELARILDAVFDGATNDTLGRHDQGAGFGLAICRLIVAHYQGKIWAESEPGKGTTVWVLLPCRRRGA